MNALLNALYFRHKRDEQLWYTGYCSPSAWNSVCKSSINLQQETLVVCITRDIRSAHLRIGEFDDVAVEVGAWTVVRKAEQWDFSVVECGVADVTRVRRPPQSISTAQDLLCTCHIH